MERFRENATASRSFLMVLGMVAIMCGWGVCFWGLSRGIEVFHLEAPIVVVGYWLILCCTAFARKPRIMDWLLAIVSILGIGWYAFWLLGAFDLSFGLFLGAFVSIVAIGSQLTLRQLLWEGTTTSLEAAADDCAYCGGSLKAGGKCPNCGAAN